jgi:RHS repeat-associated protein
VKPGKSENHKYRVIYLDKESKLEWYYFGARYYDPAIGRFLSVDPLANAFPDVTPYHYTHNNPINRIDPTGMADSDQEEGKEEEEEETDVLDIIVNSMINYFTPKKSTDEEAEAAKSETQILAEQAGTEIAETLSKSEPYVSLSIGKQTFGTGFQGSATLTKDGYAVTGGVDGTVGFGVPVGISFGLVKRADGTTATIHDLAGPGTGTTVGFMGGFEFAASPDGTAYSYGVVISPAIWAGGNAGYTIISKK